VDPVENKGDQGEKEKMRKFISFKLLPSLIKKIKISSNNHEEYKLKCYIQLLDVYLNFLKRVDLS
jgi:hypothetical protein